MSGDSPRPDWDQSPTPSWYHTFAVHRDECALPYDVSDKSEHPHLGRQSTYILVLV